MKFFRRFATIFLILILSVGGSAQTVVPDDEPRRTVRGNEFLGIKLRPEVQAIVQEIEGKSGKRILAEFIEQENFMFGSSYIGELTEENLEKQPTKTAVWEKDFCSKQRTVI